MTVRARTLTPPGPAAIAVVEVLGAGAAASVAEVFRTRAGRAGLPAEGRAAVGAIVTAAGEVADEVVLVRTAEERFEISGHGGAGAVASLLEALEAAGAELAPAAPAPLAASARTWLAFRIACWVEEGLLERDDPLARAVLEPRRVVLSGAPNAGKSSLFNALLERERAIVSAIPGTTRDVIEEETAFEGVPVRLCDTAGVAGSLRLPPPEGSARQEGALPVLGLPLPEGEGGGEGELLQAAVARARSAAVQADLVILCVDGSNREQGAGNSGRRPAAASAAAPGTGNWVGTENPRTVVVVTKADLPRAFEPPGGAIVVSARTGEGIDRLALAIATRILGRDPRSIERPGARGKGFA